MATRSTIALEFADGTVQQVYCHWDGYLDHNGRILEEHYSDPFKLRELIDLGDLSSLAPNIGTKHDFDAGADGECTFYGRDRGESDTEAASYDNYDSYLVNSNREEYNYILRQIAGKPVWFVRSYDDDMTPLVEALSMTEA